MNQQVAKQESSLPAIPQGAWGGENLSAQDILISKLLLMQPLSVKVIEGVAKGGDILDSVSGEIFADTKKEVEIIPFTVGKTWQISKVEKGGKKYVRTEAVTPANEQSPWEFEENGEKFIRQKNMNYYVFLASQVKDADAMPLVLTFRGMSMNAGKTLATHFQKCSMLGVPPASRTMKLSCKAEKNDKGNFFVFTVSSGNKTTPEAIEKAYRWYTLINRGAVRTDESDTDEATSALAAGTREEF